MPSKNRKTPKKANQPKPSFQSEDDKKRQHEWWMKILEGGRSLLNTGIIMVGICVCVYFGIYLPVAESAGESTTITVVQKWIMDANINVWIAWGVGGAGTLYGLRERHNRIKELKEREDRIKGLEDEVKNREKKS